MEDTDNSVQGVKIFPSSFNIMPTLDQRRNDMSGFLQDAIDFCLDNKVGTLQLEPGFYPIAKPLIVHSSRLTITSTGQAKASIFDAKRVPIIQLVKDADQAILVSNQGRISGDQLIGAVIFRDIAIRSYGKATRMGLLTFYNAFSCEVDRCYIGGAFTRGGLNDRNVHVDTKNAHHGHLLMMLVDRTRGSKAISWLNRVSYNYLHWSVRNALIMESSDSWIERNYISHTAGVVENNHSGNEYAGNHIDHSLGLSGQTALSFRERNATANSRDGATMVHGNYFDIHEYGIRMSDASKGTVISTNHFRACNRAYIHLANANHIAVTSNSFRVMRARHFTPIQSGAPRNITIANNINFNPFRQNLTPFLTGNTME